MPTKTDSQNKSNYAGIPMTEEALKELQKSWEDFEKAMNYVLKNGVDL